MFMHIVCGSNLKRYFNRYRRSEMHIKEKEKSSRKVRNGWDVMGEGGNVAVQ
jgi:hypothetical protein